MSSNTAKEIMSRTGTKINSKRKEQSTFSKYDSPVRKRLRSSQSQPIETIDLTLTDDSSSSSTLSSSNDNNTSAASDLSGTNPYPNMRVDFRDNDGIWSPSNIVRIHRSTPPMEPDVTIRYDGWDSSWDENVSWASPRIAKLYTYTKEVKCLADLMVKRRQIHRRSASTSCLWPCKLSLRMPDPGNEKAHELLRLEMNVLVVPYGEALPRDLKDVIESGGKWIHHSRVRSWRCDDKQQYHFGFKKAWEMGVNDETVVGTIPRKLFEQGSLLSERLRVTKPRALLLCNPSFDRPTDDVTKNNIPNISKSNIKIISQSSSPNPKPPNHDTAPHGNITYTPPSPIRITNPSRHHYTRQLQLDSQKWTASVDMCGNDIILGTFPSQPHALAARKRLLLAKKKDKADDGDDDDDEDNFLVDVVNVAGDHRAVSMEQAITAVEDQWEPRKNFSLHDWTMRRLHHQGYLSDAGMGGMMMMTEKTQRRRLVHLGRTTWNGCKEREPKAKRKKNRPQQVDLGKGCYRDITN